MTEKPNGLICWVDDDAYILEPLVWPLKREGFQVKSYLSIDEALKEEETLLKSDGVIIDILLSAGPAKRAGSSITDGLRFIKHLRSNGYRGSIVVLSVVANSRFQIRGGELESLGIDDDCILRKPTSAMLLSERVIASVERARLARKQPQA